MFKKKHVSKSALDTSPTLKVGRKGLAVFLLALLRPTDAKVATLQSDMLILDQLSNSTSIDFGQIETVDLKTGWFWSSVRLLDSGGRKTVSGLTETDARALLDGLQTARVFWWEKTLKENDSPLQAAYADIAQLAVPIQYTRSSVFTRLKQTASQVASQFPGSWPDFLSSSEMIEKLAVIRSFANNPDDRRTRANTTFLTEELKRSKIFFDNIEAKPLTQEQRKAVVVDEDHNLVVAAAGSGKTSVIVAKAGWLIDKGYRKPSDILLLAYAKDAQLEMEERVQRRLGDQSASELTVRTFHGLGLSIIGEAEGKRPTLAKVADDDKALVDLLKSIITNLLDERKFSKVMVKWFQEHFAAYRSETDFKNWGDYWEYIKSNEIRSLKGEKLRSYEECEIANFLFLNGVPYEYERSYEHDTKTTETRQYQPDFYLPESGIYIEHFGLSRSGNTAPFVNREEYTRSWKWKLQLHATHQTTLIETYSYEKTEGILTSNLARKLQHHGVKLSPVPLNEIFKILTEQGRIDPFTRLIATFLQHFKSSKLSKEDLTKRATKSHDSRRAQAFVNVFVPIFERYEEWLTERKEIDFHDMIARATDHVESGRFMSPHSYILVDEFQDISPGRARLLKALLDSSPNSQLLAVGDDWQSIYRFAGSDIALMREFSERFSASARVDLSTTFRCSKAIASAATKFILENPAQLHKEVSSVSQLDGPCISIGMPSPEAPDLLAYSLQAIEADASKLDAPISVLILGRYRHSKPENLARYAKEHPKLKITYMTIHRSKGLEADYVILVDLSSGKYGFPSQITDDPVLDIVLAAPEGHVNAEERRLFYVAMTRARRRVFLLAAEGTPSTFLKEMLDGEYEVSVIGKNPENEIACPTCVKGHLKRRKSENRTFYGCSNFPYCEYTKSACPNCSTGLIVKSNSDFCCLDCRQHVEGCPKCEGWLQQKNGKYGVFYGCSNWPNCSYTQDALRSGSSNKK